MKEFNDTLGEVIFLGVEWMQGLDCDTHLVGRLARLSSV